MFPIKRTLEWAAHKRDACAMFMGESMKNEMPVKVEEHIVYTNIEKDF